MSSCEGGGPNNGSIEDSLKTKPASTPLALNSTPQSLLSQLEFSVLQKAGDSKAQPGPEAIKSSIEVVPGNDETSPHGAPSATSIDTKLTGEDSQMKKRPRSLSPPQGSNLRLEKQQGGLQIKRSRTLAFSLTSRPSSNQKLAFQPQALGETMRAFSSRSVAAEHVSDIFGDAEDDPPILGSGAGSLQCKLEGSNPSQPGTPDTPSGIFDDADEDDTFDFAVHQKSSSAPSLLPSPPPRSLRPDLVAAILGAPPKVVPAQTTSGVSADDENNTPEKKRKKPVKPIKKVLHAKKEQEAAEKAIRGKIDLTKVLSEKDCNFLGKELWIFTVQQLEFVLSDPKEVAANNSNQRNSCRKELLNKLTESKLSGVDMDGTKFAARPNNFTRDTDNAKVETIEAPSGTTIEGNEEANLKLFAEEKILLWKEAIIKWKVSNSIDDQVLDKTQFALNGPVACLIPTCTRNFLHSTDLATAHDFLSLKRTETGLVVDMYRLWREKCGLAAVGALTIAKHLLGIGARLEIAIGSSTPVDSEERQWMGGYMIVLTGSAKDFLFAASKIVNADFFIEKRTKELADMLVVWRNEKGYPPLKGTGKVAMISGWKALVKEAKDIENHDGHVITDAKLLQEVESLIPSKKAEKKPKGDRIKTTRIAINKIPKKKLPPSVEAALNSTTFLGTIFKEERIALLANEGIRTAQELLDADKRPTSRLVASIIRTRIDSEKPGGSLEPSSCVRLVYDWCQRVKQKLEEIESSSQNQDTTNQTKHPNRLLSTRRGNGKIDPYDALSQSSKLFLETIGIKTAESFLAAKTTDVANEFVTYRVARKMPALKGLGAVASVSGWKALVRKAAKESGQGELVTLNAGRNAGIKLNRKSKEIAKEPESIPLAEPAIQEASDRDVLNGSPRRQFWINCGEIGYKFELSVRKSSSDDSKSALYITNLGSDSLKEINVPASEFKVSSLPVLKAYENPKVLEPSHNMPFSSLISNSGLIELSIHGVKPLPAVDRKDAIRSAIKTFVLEHDVTPSANSDAAYTVFEKRVDNKMKCFLYLSTEIERGQTVELKFLPWAPPSHDTALERHRRIWIQDEVSVMTLTQLRGLLDYLNEEVGANIYRRMHQTYESIQSTNDSGELALQEMIDLTVARRRMHWVALRINAQLKKEFTRCGGGSKMILPSVALAPLWTQELVSRLRHHADWSRKICPCLVQECNEEIQTEFRSNNFGKFWTSYKSWCPLAKKLFEDISQCLSGYNIELGHFSQEQKVVDDICSLVSQAVAKVKRLSRSAGSDGFEALFDLIITYDKESSHESNALPLLHEIDSLEDRKSEAIGQPLVTVPSANIVELVATRGLATTEKNSDSRGEPMVMQRIQNFEKSKHEIDVDWYVQRQVIAVSLSASLCGVAHVATESSSKLSSIRKKIKEAAEAVLDGAVVEVLELKERESTGKDAVDIPVQLCRPGIPAVNPVPHSMQFFLSAVWPILKKAKWRLEAGNTRSEVAFYPPGRNRDRQARFLKQEASIQRSRVARKTTELGLGFIPKTAKRLFISCANNDEENSAMVSVSDVLKSFYIDMTKRSSIQLEDSPRLKSIIGVVESFFEEMAPFLYASETTSMVNLDEEKSLAKQLGCEHLMRLLLVMPSMLQQSDLSVQQVNDTLGVVTELINYVICHQEKCLTSTFHLPVEDYEGQTPKFQDYIAPRLKDAKSRKNSPNGNGEEVTYSPNFREVVSPSDRHDLTSFVVTVMSQLIVCRATRDDINRKGRRGLLTVGHPGLVCRHCLGQNGEGKYFFSNVGSLSTAATSIDKHIARCPKICEDIKREMVAAKAVHAEQQKTAPPGSQTAYYTRLWERLQRSRTSAGAEADMYVTLSSNLSRKDSVSEDNTNSSSNCLGFRNHIKLLAYLQKSPPWKDNDELQSAIGTYHKCLAWGGRIYNTNAMPPHFSSEWILSKMLQ